MFNSKLDNFIKIKNREEFLKAREKESKELSGKINKLFKK